MSSSLPPSDSQNHTDAASSLAPPSTLMRLSQACLTEAGRKPINEDNAGLRCPDDAYLLTSKGAVLLVADGVSSAEAGREASQIAVSRFLDEYYLTPDTWSVSHCGEKILSTINLRLFRKSHIFVSQEDKGYLTTFSSVVIKGQEAHFFHVGDSRIYHLSGDTLRQVTTDHATKINEQRSFLTRALGMDSRLHLDYGHFTLNVGDTLLLCSDGISDFIESTKLRDMIKGQADLELLARELLDQALENQSDDNLSVALTRVNALPTESLADYSAKLTRLPFPPPLSVGMKVDGLRIDKELYASSRSEIYLVTDMTTNESYVMKTPSRVHEEDVNYIDRFIQEEWIGRRIQHPNVVHVLPQTRERTFLYYLMTPVSGVTLEQWLQDNPSPSPKRCIALVKQIAEGLRAFHDNEALHQDLNPANILITPDEDAIIIDFGSVYVAGLAEMHRPLVHQGVLGTLEYSDPNYLLGESSGIAGDVYSLATISYQMFTGGLPYGDKITRCKTARDYDRLRYKRAANYNSVIPIWFDSALRKGVALDLGQRYSTIANLLTDLCQPNPDFLRDDPVEKRSANTLLFWQVLSGFWFFILILVVYLFSQRV